MNWIEKHDFIFSLIIKVIITKIAFLKSIKYIKIAKKVSNALNSLIKLFADGFKLKFE